VDPTCQSQSTHSILPLIDEWTPLISIVFLSDLTPAPPSPHARQRSSSPPRRLETCPSAPKHRSPAARRRPPRSSPLCRPAATPPMATAGSSIPARVVAGARQEVAEEGVGELLWIFPVDGDCPARISSWLEKEEGDERGRKGSRIGAALTVASPELLHRSSPASSRRWPPPFCHALRSRHGRELRRERRGATRRRGGGRSGEGRRCWEE